MRVSNGLIGLMIGALWGCAVQPQARGFALPPGDPIAGRQAFIELRCTACHQVEDVALPAPVASPPVPLVLGGDPLVPPTDGEIVSSIIYPQHSINAEFVDELEKSGADLPRMGDFKSSMTVQQLVDLVSFLRTVYRAADIQPAIPYPGG